MPWCAVGSLCLSNSKHERNFKVSYFSIPKNENLRSQWVQSIPTVSSLQGNQRICSRHFDENDIIKEYIKFDSDGKIIAQVCGNFL